MPRRAAGLEGIVLDRSWPVGVCDRCSSNDHDVGPALAHSLRIVPRPDPTGREKRDVGREGFTKLGDNGFVRVLEWRGSTGVSQGEMDVVS